MYRNNRFQRYKNIYYLYDSVEDTWVVSNNKDYTLSTLMVCNGDMLITDVFEIFRKALKCKYG